MAEKPRSVKFPKPYPRAVCVDDHEYLGADANGCLSYPKTGARFLVSLTLGKTYEICGEDLDLGWWSVIDNTGEAYLYPKSYFRNKGAPAHARHRQRPRAPFHRPRRSGRRADRHGDCGSPTGS